MTPNTLAVRERRFARIAVDAQMIAGLLMSSKTFRVVRHGLPTDALCMTVYADTGSHVLWLQVAHPSFDPLPVGAQVPALLDVFLEVV